MRKTAYAKVLRGFPGKATWCVFFHWADEPFLEIGEPLSCHKTEADADAAIKRYTANDSRRATGTKLKAIRAINEGAQQ